MPFKIVYNRLNTVETVEFESLQEAVDIAWKYDDNDSIYKWLSDLGIYLCKYQIDLVEFLREPGQHYAELARNLLQKGNRRKWRHEDKDEKDWQIATIASFFQEVYDTGLIEELIY